MNFPVTAAGSAISSRTNRNFYRCMCVIERYRGGSRRVRSNVALENAEVPLMRKLVVMVMAAVLLPAAVLQAQQLSTIGGPPYRKGYSFFPTFIGPYRAMDVPPPVMGNSGRVDDLLREGKLTLS